MPYPLDKGDKLRAFHQISYLSQKHEIVLFCLNSGKNISEQSLNTLKNFCKRVEIFNLNFFSIFIRLVLNVFNTIPYQSAFFYNSKAKRNLTRLIQFEKPDRAFFQMIRTAEYAKDLSIPCIIDYQDALSKGVERRLSKSNLFMRYLLKMEYKRLLKYEALVFNIFKEKIIISEQDRDLIPHEDKQDIKVISNGVDLNYFFPINAEKRHSILFTGNMGYPPNIDAARYLALEILPLVNLKIPSANLLISGSRPSSKVTQLENEQVIVSGWVDDIRDSYASANVFVAPMRLGSGLQNKLLEAMAMQLPCITTPLANNALGAESGKQIIIADTTEGIANAIVALLLDEKYADSIAKEGYDFVEKKYNWEEVNAVLENVLCSDKVIKFNK